MRQPGVEPGSTAWKATMLTVTPLTPHDFRTGNKRDIPRRQHHNRFGDIGECDDTVKVDRRGSFKATQLKSK